MAAARVVGERDQLARRERARRRRARCDSTVCRRSRTARMGSCSSSGARPSYGQEKFHSVDARPPRRGIAQRTRRPRPSASSSSAWSACAERACAPGWPSSSTGTPGGGRAPPSRSRRSASTGRGRRAPGIAAMHLLGQPVDTVRATGPFDGYDVVLVPNLYIADAEQAAALSAFAEAGGRVVVGPFSGVVDATEKVHDGGAPGSAARAARSRRRRAVAARRRTWSSRSCTAARTMPTRPGRSGSRSAADTSVRGRYASGELDGAPRRHAPCGRRRIRLVRERDARRRRARRGLPRCPRRRRSACPQRHPRRLRGRHPQRRRHRLHLRDEPRP